MTAEPDRLITSYTELIIAIDAQRVLQGVRLVDFDHLAGFPSGLSGKAFGMPCAGERKP